MKEIEFTISPLKLRYDKGRSVGRRNYAGYSEKRKESKLRKQAEMELIGIYEMKKTRKWKI